MIDLVKNDVYDFIKYARGMQHWHPEHAEKYKTAEIELLFEALEAQSCQIKRGELESRLKELGILDRQERKKRWSAFFKSRIQNKIAAVIKTHPLKAKRLIERLKKI